MSDRTCIACARSIPVGRRADATTCGRACYTWARRHPGVRKPIGPQAYVCEHCTETFTRAKRVGGKPPRFCDARCWEAWRHRQRPFGEWRREEPFSPRSFICVDCGEGGTDSGRGPRASRCGACRRMYEVAAARGWALANPDRRRQIASRWAQANPGKSREWYERNRDRHRQYMRDYQRRNHDRVLAWKRDRQARRRALQAATVVEIFTSTEVYERDQWVCGICGEIVDPDCRHPDPMSPSLDHVVPLSRGGAHVRSNVQLAHLSCNVKKGASLM